MDATSQSILDFLDARRDELIDFTCELVATPSINPPGDERAVASVVVNRLRALGFDKPEVVARSPERPNVLCRLRGSGDGPVLMYNGHIDTKPVGDDARALWKTDPLEPTIIDGKLYGLGATDMKSGVASIIYAAAAVREAGVPLRGDLLLVLNADEEAGGAYGAIHLAQDHGVKADMILIAEPCGLERELERICIVARGGFCFRVRVHGTQMHSSTSDLRPSINASAKMAYVLWRMERDLKIRHEPHPFYPQGVTRNIGVKVDGGVFYGVFPGTADFCSDIRIHPGMMPAEVARDVEDFLETLRREDPDLDVEMIEELNKSDLREVTQPDLDPDDPFVQSLVAASGQVLGRPLPLAGFEGGTDGVYWHVYGGIPAVPAFGPGLLPLAHGPNEYVGVEAIVQASKMQALAAFDYLK